uniref:Uncharacterized protein n=1 Tax=Ditylum brightwellii TaxID=49249 RepID=A0A7S4QHY6_9STRA
MQLPESNAAVELCCLLQTKPHNNDVILNFCFDNRTAASIKCKVGNEDEQCYPLSFAINQKASFDIIFILCKQFPPALAELNQRKETPLHIAVRRNNDMDILTMLLDESPESASKVTVYGCTPLHYLCERNPSAEALSLFLSKYPQATEKKDACGRVLLHCVFEGKISLAAVSLLLAHNPNAVEEKKQRGTDSFTQCMHVPCILPCHSENAGLRSICSFVTR